MKIEIGTLAEGGVVLAFQPGIASVVKRVEYYQEQRLFMLVYHNDNREDEMLPFEIPDSFEKPIDTAPNILIYALFEGHDPVGYRAPLIKVGDFY